MAGSSPRIAQLEQDFGKVDFGSVGRFDVHLFDGPYRAQDHAAGIETLFASEIRTTLNGGAPRGPQSETSEWHDGHFIAVRRKSARA